MSKLWYDMRNYSFILAAILSIFGAITAENPWVWVNTAAATFVIAGMIFALIAQKYAEREQMEEYMEHVEELEAMGQKADIELKRLKLFREYEGGKS